MMKSQDIHPIYLHSAENKEWEKRDQAKQTEKFNSSTSKTPITCIFPFKLQGGK